MIPALARWNGDHAMTKDTTKEAAVAAEALLLDDWFDAIEDGIRARARGFIETMLPEEELSEALSRPRYGRRKPGEDEAFALSVVGVRHGHRRERTLTGTFGKTRIAVPRARLTGEDGKTREWRSGSLRAYQRRTWAADALIAAAYLAGTNTRRVRRALNAVFAGPVGKDVVSRVWRKTKGDWDAWNARSLAEEPIVRLILDGTVARVRLDRKGDLDLVARGAWRARRRPEDAARDQEHGRGRRGGLACAARRSRPARIAERRSWSSSTARRASKRRWRRCGPTWLSNAAPCTSIAISSPTRPSACTRKSRTTTAT